MGARSDLEVSSLLEDLSANCFAKLLSCLIYCLHHRFLSGQYSH